MEIAREQVARLIGAETKEIIFTSGATEGDNLALKGVFEAYASKGNHIITVVTEHKAVLDAAHHIERLGGEVTFLSVNAEGADRLQRTRVRHPANDDTHRPSCMPTMRSVYSSR